MIIKTNLSECDDVISAMATTSTPNLSVTERSIGHHVMRSAITSDTQLIPGDGDGLRTDPRARTLFIEAPGIVRYSRAGEAGNCNCNLV